MPSLLIRALASATALFSLWISFLAPLSDAAGPETAKATVETIITKAKTLDNKATHKQTAGEIESLVDFQKLGADALGNHLNELKPAQRTEVQNLLKSIITKTVYPEAPKFFKDVKIDFTTEDTQGTTTHVTSTVTKGDKRSTVEYWLEEKAPKTYRVIDLAIEGERWVENVRDQFDEVIRKYGVNGLIERMKKRLKTLETK